MLKNKKDIQSDDEGANVDVDVGAGVNVEQTLCSYITQTLLPPDYGIEVKPDDDLLSIDYLDSMQFMRLVQFTEETYALKIPAEDLLIENFQTVERLTHYLSERISGT